MFKLSGFTLVEVMVAVAISGILLSVGIPSLATLYQETRSQHSIKRINSIIAFARNQALSYHRSILVCPVAPHGCGVNWKNGIQVIIPNNAQTPQGGVDPLAGHQLKVYEAFDDSDFVVIPQTSLRLSKDGTITNINADIVIRYCPGSKTSKESLGLRVRTAGTTRIIKTAINCN
ncbi:MAG: GspH/FimT family pseudopilin [Parashewanella sp.]